MQAACWGSNFDRFWVRVLLLRSVCDIPHDVLFFTISIYFDFFLYEAQSLHSGWKLYKKGPHVEFTYRKQAAAPQPKNNQRLTLSMQPAYFSQIVQEYWLGISLKFVVKNNDFILLYYTYRHVAAAICSASRQASGGTYSTIGGSVQLNINFTPSFTSLPTNFEKYRLHCLNLLSLLAGHLFRSNYYSKSWINIYYG